MESLSYLRMRHLFSLLGPVVAGNTIGHKRMVTSQVTSKPWDGHQVWLFGFLQERMQEQTTVKGEKVYSGKKHTP